MGKTDNLRDFLADLYQGIVSKKPGASKNPQDFRREIESISTGNNTPDPDLISKKELDLLYDKIGDAGVTNVDISNLTNTRWKLKRTIAPLSMSYSINFNTSNSSTDFTCTKLIFKTNTTTGEYGLTYHTSGYDLTVYEGDSTSLTYTNTTDKLRYISITGGDGVTNADLIAWFKQYGDLLGSVDVVSDKIQSLIDAANETTGNDDETLTEAVSSLSENYGVGNTPTSYTVTNVDELPDDAVDGSIGIVKESEDDLKWRNLNWKNWNPCNEGISKFTNDMWTDGASIYYSKYLNQLVLKGDTWETKTWSGLTDFYGEYIWTDRNDIYYSYGGSHYVLNGDTWETKTWNGSIVYDYEATYIWNDGTNIYYSNGTDQYVLNGDTWETKTWSGLTKFYGDYIWTDGNNVYYSNGTDQYVLNGDTWETKTWSGLTDFYGEYIWSDGFNMYYSQSINQYVLNGDTWEAKSGNTMGLIQINGLYVKYILGDVYCGQGGYGYILSKNHETLYIRENGAWIERDILDDVVTTPTATPVPPKITSATEMTSLLETAEVGTIYKYIGESGTYENGAYYVVESETTEGENYVGGSN